MKPLAPLPIHGAQFKVFPNIKLMHYTVACQIFISESICFLYWCLVMTVKSVNSTFVLYWIGKRKYAGTLWFCSGYLLNLPCLDIVSLLSAVCGSTHITY
jgi:hypothetical protein